MSSVFATVTLSVLHRLHLHPYPDLKLEALSTMALVEDDTILHPEIEADSLLYVSSLNEDVAPYTRFFDALLIKRSLHHSFFRDLKSFREQPRLIAMLEQAGQERTIYKEVTILFSESRFAHPWCRQMPQKKDSWRAEWGTVDGKQKDADIAREEQRLHKLLVPIWVIMRSKMFPGDEIVKTWCLEERSRSEKREAERLTAAAPNLCNAEAENPVLKPSRTEPETGPWNGHHDDDESNDESDDGQQQAAHAATSVFRLAVAGAILSQTPKRKLRWLVKKPR